MNAPSLSLRAARLSLIALAFLVPLVPVSDEAPLGKALLFAGLAGLGGLALWVDALRGRAAPTLGTPTDITFAAFLACALPSFFMAGNPGQARMELGLLACLGFTYVLAVKALRRPADVRRLYLAVLLSALVISVVGLLEYQRFLREEALPQSRSDYLSTDFFRHSYLAAQYVVLVFVGGVVLVCNKGLGLLPRIALGLALIPQAAYLLAIGSRGAYLAVFVSLAVSAALSLPSGSSRLERLTRLGFKAGAAAVALLLLYVVASATGLTDADLVTTALERIQVFFDPRQTNANFERAGIWESTLALVADHPVSGVGLGTYAQAMLPYQGSTQLVPHAHNQFLQVLAQSGLIGLVGLAFLVRHAAHAARKGAAFLEHDAERRPLFHAAVASLVAALLYCLIETPLHWIEAGSLIVILMAVMSRAGCTSRDAVSSRGVAHLALVGGALALAIAAMSWVPFARFARELTRALELASTAPPLDPTPASTASTADSVWVEVEALIEAADERYPYTLLPSRIGANLALSRGDRDQALTWLKRGLERFPQAPYLLSNLGNLYIDAGRAAHAPAVFQSLALRPENSFRDTYRTLLARAYQWAGAMEEAWLIQQPLTEDEDFRKLEPTILLDGAASLIVLGRDPDRANDLLACYLRQLDGDDNGRPDAQPGARYKSLRARLERSFNRPARQLQRGERWGDWARAGPKTP